MDGSAARIGAAGGAPSFGVGEISGALGGASVATSERADDGGAGFDGGAGDS
jgi:hypothetical protein